MQGKPRRELDVFGAGGFCSAEKDFIKHLPGSAEEKDGWVRTSFFSLSIAFLPSPTYPALLIGFSTCLLK
jgi:hypothetical protein